MMIRILLSLLLFHTFCLKLYSQHNISGLVMDDKHQGIAEVSIKWEGDKNSTISNAAGEFSVAQKHPGVLIFTHKGYDTLYYPILANDRRIVVQLIPNKIRIEAIDIIHTGYQNLTRERATGSFEVIGQKEINQRVTTNIIKNLEGFLPGVLFDNRTSSNRFHVRGINSLTDQLTAPLIVVDNFPYSGNINSIDPQDVESVTVLKDAAAASIWGARAGNGVLVITTKKSKANNVSVEGSVNLVTAEKPKLMRMNVLNSQDFMAIEKELFDLGVFDGLLQENSISKLLVTPYVELLNRIRKGDISEHEAASRISDWQSRDYRKDLLNEYYRNPISQKYRLSVNAGHDTFHNRISLSYDQDIQDQLKSNYNRMGLLWNGNYKPIKHLSFQYALSLNAQNGLSSLETLNYPINPGGGRSSLYPYAQLIDRNGKPLAIERGFANKWINQFDDILPRDWTYKPLEDIQNSTRKSNINQMRTSVEATYKPFNEISLKLLYGLNYQTTNGESHYSPESYYVRNLQNSFSSLENGKPISAIPEGGILDKSYSTLREQRIRFQANIDHPWSTNHAIHSILGTELSDQPIESNSYRYYGYVDEIKFHQPVNYLSTFPTFQGILGNAYIPRYGDLGSRNSRMASFFGNASYTFRNRYLITASARKDASNAFGVATNKRWKPLWSMGLGWELSKEEFVSKLKIIDYLKIRSTWGHSGNSGGIGSSEPIISILPASTNGLNSDPEGLISSMPYVDLKWEDVRMLNIGLDFSLFNSRLSGAIEYFNKKSVDLLANDPLDPTSGMSSMTKNVAQMIGNGFDVQFSSKNIEGNLSWQTDFYLSMAKDRVTKFYGKEGLSRDYLTARGTELQPTLHRSLYPVFAFYSTGLDEYGDPMGIFQGEASKDYVKLTSDSLKNIRYVGGALPTFHGSLRNSFRYKGLTLNVNLLFKFGNYFVNNSVNYAKLINEWDAHADAAKRWRKPGDEQFTYVPALKLPLNSNREFFYQFSEVLVEPAGVVRLQDINLSYPLKLNKRVGLILFCALNNAGIIWRQNRSGVDPDNPNIASPRVYTCGITFKPNAK